MCGGGGGEGCSSGYFKVLWVLGVLLIPSLLERHSRRTQWVLRVLRRRVYSRVLTGTPRRARAHALLSRFRTKHLVTCSRDVHLRTHTPTHPRTHFGAFPVPLSLRRRAHKPMQLNPALTHRVSNERMRARCFGRSRARAFTRVFVRAFWSVVCACAHSARERAWHALRAAACAVASRRAGSCGRNSSACGASAAVFAARRPPALLGPQESSGRVVPSRRTGLRDQDTRP